MSQGLEKAQQHKYTPQRTAQPYGSALVIHSVRLNAHLWQVKICVRKREQRKIILARCETRGEYVAIETSALRYDSEAQITIIRIIRKRSTHTNQKQRQFEQHA